MPRAEEREKQDEVTFLSLFDDLPQGFLQAVGPEHQLLLGPVRFTLWTRLTAALDGARAAALLAWHRPCWHHLDVIWSNISKIHPGMFPFCLIPDVIRLLIEIYLILSAVGTLQHCRKCHLIHKSLLFLLCGASCFWHVDIHSQAELRIFYLSIMKWCSVQSLNSEPLKPSWHFEGCFISFRHQSVNKRLQREQKAVIQLLWENFRCVKKKNISVFYFQGWIWGIWNSSLCILSEQHCSVSQRYRAVVNSSSLSQ